MKALKVILIILAVIVAAFIIWMFTLPSSYKVERSAVIKAPKKVVFSQVSDFKHWEKWGPWLEQDSTMEFSYNEQTSGVGASYTWTAESGNGYQEFTAIVPHDTIRTLIRFEGQGEANGLWIFTPVEEGQKTKVSWSFSGDLSFFTRFLGVLMERMVGPMFETGLNNLAAVAEAKAEEMAAAPEILVEESTFEPIDYYSVKDRVSFENMGPEFFEKRYGELAKYLGPDFKNMVGPPMAIYHEWNEEEKMATVEVALPVNSEKAGDERVKRGTSLSGDILKVTYKGNYNGTGMAHEAIYEYAQKNEIEIIGSPMEIYVTDPAEEPDTAKWITEVIYPVNPK